MLVLALSLLLDVAALVLWPAFPLRGFVAGIATGILACRYVILIIILLTVVTAPMVVLILVLRVVCSTTAHFRRLTDLRLRQLTGVIRPRELPSMKLNRIVLLIRQHEAERVVEEDLVSYIPRSLKPAHRSPLHIGLEVDHVRGHLAE